MQTIDVFISSTHNEFRVARQKIKSQLKENNINVVMSEDIYTEKSPSAQIQSTLARVNVVVCIFGKQFGYIPSEENPNQLSATALELRWATDLEKPIYVLVQKGDDDREAQLREFLANVGNFTYGKWLKEFSTHGELSEMALKCVQDYMAHEHIFGDESPINNNFWHTYSSILRERLDHDLSQYQVHRYIMQEGKREAGIIPMEFHRATKMRWRLSKGHWIYRRVDLSRRIRTKRISDITRFLMRTDDVTVLKGEPGSGKTTAMRYVALQLLEKLDLSNIYKGFLPVFVRLGRYKSRTAFGKPARVQPFIWDEIDYLFADQSQDFIKDLRHALHKLIQRGNVFFLFDALDEMPAHDQDKRYKKISDYASKILRYGNKVIFSCRERNYDHSFRAQEILLAPFNKRRITQFISWHLIPSHEHHKATLTTELLDPINGLDKLCQNPFFLQLIILFLNRSEDFRNDLQRLLARCNLAKLFEEVISLKFENANQRGDHSIDNRELFSRVLGQLAIATFDPYDEKSGLSRKEFIESFTEYPYHTIKTVLAAAENENILVPGGSSECPVFRHRLLQEYFMAKELVARNENPDKALGLPLDSFHLEDINVLYAGMVEDASEIIVALISKDELSA